MQIRLPIACTALRALRRLSVKQETRWSFNNNYKCAMIIFDHPPTQLLWDILHIFELLIY